MFDTVNTNIKPGTKWDDCQKVIITCTINKSLRVADVSEDLNKALEENTLMRLT